MLSSSKKGSNTVLSSPGFEIDENEEDKKAHFELNGSRRIENQEGLEKEDTNQNLNLSMDQEQELSRQIYLN